MLRLAVPYFYRHLFSVPVYSLCAINNISCYKTKRNRCAQLKLESCYSSIITVNDVTRAENVLSGFYDIALL